MSLIVTENCCEVMEAAVPFLQRGCTLLEKAKAIAAALQYP